MGEQGKDWCFTNFRLLDKEEYESWGAEYVIWGIEKCPKTGKSHHQGFVRFKSNKRMSALKKIDKEIHWEKRRSTVNQAIEYCMKEDKYTEIGEKPVSKQGKRNDIVQVREAIKAGKPNHEIIEEVTSIQAGRFIENCRNLMIKPRKEKPRVEWFYGGTGTGKTRTAVELFNEDYDDCSYSNGGFLIGYKGNRNVLFDDFRGNIPFNLILKMLDRYKCTVNVKGGEANFSAQHIIITAPRKPKDIYKGVGEDIEQLNRRIDNIRLFGDEPEEETIYDI